MIEKLNKVFEKLPPEHRDIMREAFTILIEEVINAVVKDNERIWQSIEKIWQAIDRLTNAIEKMEKTFNERFERQEKENERIWQNIERIWHAIEEVRKDMKEGFERQAQENEKIWQAIKEGFERQEKENQRIWHAIEEVRKDMKEGFDRMNRKIEGLGARWGLMAEETFRAGLKTIIEDLGYVVENVVFFDDEGDVSTFERKVKLYERKFNIKIDKKIILTPFANSKAIEIAKSLDIEIVEELKE
ncbi:MAG: DUF3782 domain-containing protein [Candidatus Hydrothermia bacterium]|jgi:hypothetical protein